MRLTRGSLGNTDSGVLLLPIEVSVRELEAKLVLAARVAQRGMTVVIGHKESVNQFAKLKCPPGAVYLAKSVPRPGVDDVWEIIRGRALRCLAQDEEAGLQNEFFADVLRKSPALSRLSHLHAYLCWGPEDHEVLGYREAVIRASHGSGNSEIMLSGSPRASLWGALGQTYFCSEIASLRRKFGNYLLVATSLASANHVLGVREYEKWVVKNRRHFTTFSSEEHGKTVSSEKLMVTAYRDLLTKLVNSTHEQILLRPHPDEDSSMWMDLIEEFPTLHLADEGDITPLILGAKALIHSSSTTAFAAYANVPYLIAFLPGEEVEKIRMASNQISEIAESCEAVTALLEQTPFSYKNRRRETLVERKVKGRGTLENLDAIADSIECFAAPCSNLDGFGFRLNAQLVLRALGRFVFGLTPRSWIPAEARLASRKRPILRRKILEQKLSRAITSIGATPTRLKVVTRGGRIAIISPLT